MKNTICPLCGHELLPNANVNRDHLIPKAVFLWSKDLLNKQKYQALKRYVNSHINIYLVHERCNYRKQSALLNLTEVKKMHFSEENMTKIIKMYTSLNSQLNCYRQKAIFLTKKQKSRCFKCRRKYGRKSRRQLANQFVIRRIDPKKARSWENACLVCHKCNRIYKSFVRLA